MHYRIARSAVVRGLRLHMAPQGLPTATGIISWKFVAAFWRTFADQPTLLGAFLKGQRMSWLIILRLPRAVAFSSVGLVSSKWSLNFLRSDYYCPEMALSQRHQAPSKENNDKKKLWLPEVVNYNNKVNKVLIL